MEIPEIFIDPYTGFGNKYNIVSKVAYLIGVNEKYTRDQGEGIENTVFKELEKEKPARIIRNLCTLRTQMIKNNSKIWPAVHYESKTLIGLKKYVSIDAMEELKNDGVNVYVSLDDPNGFSVNLNKNINNHINNCKRLFPDWINWEYLSDLFLVPNGNSTEGIKNAAAKYYENTGLYPFSMFINWDPEECGNILFSDKKFVSLLYKWHNDEFTDFNLVSDVSEQIKANIYSFIKDSDKCIFVVDCENSDPYNLCAAINGLDEDKIQKISKVVLFDDKNAAVAWKFLEKYMRIPVEYIMIERIKENKSLTDIQVAVRICKECLTNNVDSIVLVSSDSDYWGLIKELPDTNFLVMVEHDKCSPALKNKLNEKDITYCYIDDFYAEGGEEIKNAAINKEINEGLNIDLNINLRCLMTETLKKTRIKMTEDDITKFIEKKLKPNISLKYTKSGDIELNYESFIRNKK